MDIGTIVTGIVALAGGFFASLLGEWDIWLQILFLSMTLDIITGMGKCVYHCSAKTPGGCFSSTVFTNGVLRKGAILAVIMVAVMIDGLMVSQGYSYDLLFIDSIRNAVILFFWIGELFSILENCAEMGVPIPRVLKSFLEIMHDEIDASKDDEPSKDDDEPHKH